MLSKEKTPKCNENNLKLYTLIIPLLFLKITSFMKIGLDCVLHPLAYLPMDKSMGLLNETKSFPEATGISGTILLCC